VDAFEFVLHGKNCSGASRVAGAAGAARPPRRHGRRERGPVAPWVAVGQGQAGRDPQGLTAG
jgi:hypothetical protein